MMQNVKGKEDMPLLPLVTYDRWNSMRTEELALTLTKYMIQRAGPALPWQQTRAGPCGTEGVRAGKLVPLLAVWNMGGASQGSDGELAWRVMMRDSWQADKPSYYPCPEPGI